MRGLPVDCNDKYGSAFHATDWNFNEEANVMKSGRPGRDRGTRLRSWKRRGKPFSKRGRNAGKEPKTAQSVCF